MTVELSWNGKAQAKSEALLGPSSYLIEGANPNTNPSLFQPRVESDTHHVLIGDNLEVMRCLKAQGDLSFHFIYIDPPYNSGQNFTFKDAMPPAANQTQKDSESGWLSMMWPRLSLAHDLLKDTGVMFVSIDDRELAALSLMMFEIFGKENHIGTLKWKKKRKPSFLDKHMSSTLEYVLVFAKDAKKAARFLGEKTLESTRPVLNASNQITLRILKKGTKAFCKEGKFPKGNYVNRTLGVELLDEAVVKNGVLEKDVRVNGRFRVSQEILDKTVFITRGFGLRRRVDDSELKRKHASDDCTDWPTNEDAEAELRAIFGQRVFDFPKPVGLLRNLLRMCQVNLTETTLCLDFFAGTGTLAEAVLAQNAEDGAKRVFFCVQSPEKLKATPPGSNFTSISEITVARAQHAMTRFKEVRPLRVLTART